MIGNSKEQERTPYQINILLMFTKPTRWQDGLSEYRESNGAMSYCILGNVLKWTLLLLQRTLVPDCWLANGLVGKWRHHCLQSDPDWTLKALDFLFLEMKQKGRNPEFYVAARDSGFTSKPNPETRMKKWEACVTQGQITNKMNLWASIWTKGESRSG